MQSLKLKKDFKALMNEEIRKVDSFFIFFGKKGATEDLRFGLIASKKVFPLAVHRNKAKRRVRAALRAIYLKYKGDNIDVVLILRKNSLVGNFTELVSRLERALQQV